MVPSPIAVSDDKGLTWHDNKEVGTEFGIKNSTFPEVVAGDRAELESAAQALAPAEILACAPLSLRAIKQIVRRTAQLDVVEGQAARLPALLKACGYSGDDVESIGHGNFVRFLQRAWK
jgi:enoyl-CoA hydratase/carnithine racemase